jgi:hypothetical protein
MRSEIERLVNQGDAESLNEIMVDEDDWRTQMDAAEGLIKLRDRRGLDYLALTVESEDEDIGDAAAYLLEGPDAKSLQAEMDAQDALAHEERIRKAKTRLQHGRKVFQHKMLYLPAGAIMADDLSDDGYSVPELAEAGLEGWEVVNFIPRRNKLLVGSVDDFFVGAYFVLKREVSPDEVDELK